MKVVIISGPSGVGKNTIISELFKKSSNFERIITTTTREIRGKEVHGVDYYYISHEEFKSNVESGKMIEYAIVHRNYYGSTYAELERLTNNGKIPIYEVDPQGAKHLSKTLKDKYEDCDIITIFLLSPNNEELKKRLAYRGVDTSEEIEKRFVESLKQIEEQDFYDYRVINDDIARTTETLLGIIS